jgi:hypothetical protein
MSEWVAAGRKAGVAYLKAKVLDANPHRLLRTLEPFEFDGLVCAMVEAADAKRAEITERERAAGNTLEQALDSFDPAKGDSLDGVFPAAKPEDIFS